jgi:hypothetical protein
VLDFLFGFGEALALLALVSGFVITIGCGLCADEPRNAPRKIVDIDSLRLRSEKRSSRGLVDVQNKARARRYEHRLFVLIHTVQVEMPCCGNRRW